MGLREIGCWPISVVRRGHYLAVVLDVYSRRIVGWAMDSQLRTALMLQALDMALAQRRPTAVIHHSDQGCQYTSVAFGQRCREAGVRPSMGSVGDAYDNAMCEAFFATLECELLNRSHFATHDDARRALFTWIEGWYNPHRLHSALGYRSPQDSYRPGSGIRRYTGPTLPHHKEKTHRHKIPMRICPMKRGNPNCSSSTSRIVALERGARF